MKCEIVKVVTPLVSPLSSPTVVIPANVEEKQCLWYEDAFDPIIVRHLQEVYDVCQGKLYSTSLASWLVYNNNANGSACSSSEGFAG